MDIVAYTDGGCRSNPGGVGAWAFVLIETATKRALECADAVHETTSNRMELMAAIEALSALRRPRLRDALANHAMDSLRAREPTRWERRLVWTGGLPLQPQRP